MSAPRTIQNFRGFRGVWWGPPGAAAETLAGALSRLGASFDVPEAIRIDTLSHGRDIVFIDGDGVFDTAKLCAPGSGLPIVPVVGVVGVEAPSRLKGIVR